MVLALSNLIRAYVGDGCRARPRDRCQLHLRWVQVYGPELDKRCRRHLKQTNRSWRLDETYINVKGRDRFLYRAVDSAGQTIDFLLTERRDAGAAKRFLSSSAAE